ncbi:MAG: 16S rRNA (guanine(527)-N(7))-methyltransferase RsmG [Armatimonadota bacterium]
MIEERLVKGAFELGVKIDSEQSEKFAEYTELLLEWNQKFNLTSIVDPGEIGVKHYLDSLSCFRAARFRNGDEVADVGTGAGFPGVPIAIARPDVKVTLIEATNKKLTFLDEVRQQLNLSNIELMHSRAEEAGRIPEHREHYNIVTARAVADMRMLVEYCLPLVRVGGVFIAMKGPDVDSELDGARPGIGTLGGGHPEIIRLTLPGTDIQRSLIVIKKQKPTPEEFPRHGAKIVKKPL